MSFFDLVLVILLAAFVLYGLWFGLIHAFGSLIGVIIGAFGAGRLFEPIAMKFLWLFGGNANLARIVVFFVLFVFANRIIGLVFYLLEQSFKVFTIIPFLSSINRLAGAVFGFLEGSLVLGGALMIAAKFPLNPAFTAGMAQSQIAAYLLSVAGIIVPLLPELIRQVDRALPYKLPTP